jgi:hypothetical protein
MSEKIPIFISISTAPYRGNQEYYINNLYSILDKMGFERNTLGVTAFSHKKGFIDISRMIKRCFGAIIIGIPRDYISKKIKKEGLDEKEEIIKDKWVSTVWNDIEGAMAYQCDIPMLILRDIEIPNDDGVFHKDNLDLKQHPSYLYLDIDSSNPDELVKKEFRKKLEMFYQECQKYKKKNQEVIPVFLSASSSNLDSQNSFLEKIKEYLGRHNIILTNLDPSLETESGFISIKKTLDISHGAMIIGFKRDHTIKKTSRKEIIDKEEDSEDSWESTLWNHIEGAMAYEAGLPLIILKQSEIKLGNGIFDDGNHEFKIIDFDPKDDLDYHDEIQKPPLFKIIDQWINHVKNYREYKRLGDKIMY